MPRTLAPGRYIDAGFAGRERSRLWPNVWQFVCPESDVLTRGSFVELEVGDQSMFVVRGRDGVLRGFRNVCPHRGTRIVEGCGRAATLRCPYHRWSWRLDGTIAGIPDRAAFEPIDDDDAGLLPVRVDTWEGLVFACHDPHAPDLSTFLGPVVDRFRRYELAAYGTVTSASVRIEANWKAVCDSFLEAYHIQGIHRQVMPFIDYTDLHYEQWDLHSHMVVPVGVPSPSGRMLSPTDVLRAMVADEVFHGAVLQELGVGLDAEVPEGLTARAHFAALNRAFLEQHGVSTELNESQLVDDHHYFLFPNLIVNHFGSSCLLSRVRPAADSHERSWWDMWILSRVAPMQASAPAVYDGAGTDMLGIIANQDIDCLPGVQRGMHDLGLKQVRLGTNERRVASFHDAIDLFLDAPD